MDSQQGTVNIFDSLLQAKMIT
jgi:hypothetical protein